METSPLFSLNYQDFVKGLIVAAGGAGLTAIETTLQAGALVFNWKAIAEVAIAAGLSYLGKNFFTPALYVVPIK